MKGTATSAPRRIQLLTVQEKPCSPWFNTKGVNQSPRNMAANTATSPPKALRLNLPPEFAGVGDVVLQTDANNEIAEVWSDIGLTLSVLTIFCALVLAFVYWSLGTAIRPLQNLTAAFARVGERDYRERVKEQGPLELVHLSQGFNKMVEQLAHTGTLPARAELAERRARADRLRVDP